MNDIKDLAREINWLRADVMAIMSFLESQALAAARELRDMKPVGITSEKYPHECYLFDGVVLPPETLLYALGESND